MSHHFAHLLPLSQRNPFGAMKNIEPEIRIVTPIFFGQFVRYTFAVGRDTLYFYLLGSETFSTATKVDQKVIAVIAC